MKSMLIIATLIAVAVAGPVLPGMPGPAPIVEESPIAVGPAIIDGFEQVPISVGPAIVEGFELPPVIEIPGPDGTTLIQIILNIQGAAAEVIIPNPAETPVVPEISIPGPVNVVDNVVVEIPSPLPDIVIPGPVNVVDNVVGGVVPEPIIVGIPVVPGPVNVVDNIIAPEPVIVGTPVVADMA